MKTKAKISIYVVCYILSICLAISLTYIVCKKSLEPEVKIEYVDKIVEKEVIKEVEVVKERPIEEVIDEYFNSYYRLPMDEPVWLSSSAGPRTLEITDNAFHQGDDYTSSNPKAKIRAAADGIVVEHWPAPNGYYKGHPTYGGYIIIKHDNGTYTKYAHMSDTCVHQGERVKQGQQIGVIGSTGVSTGIHLHFEITVVPNQFFDNIRR